jgi:hypothetical protein
MYVSISKQLKISKIVSVLSWLCQGKGLKIFSHLKFPMGNITLYQGNMLPMRYGLSGLALAEEEYL